MFIIVFFFSLIIALAVLFSNSSFSVPLFEFCSFESLKDNDEKKRGEIASPWLHQYIYII